MTAPNNEFTCTVCHETFEKGLSDSEAVEQYAEEFPECQGVVPLSETDLVCDDCYKKILPWLDDGNRL
jgi:hypothetical protein